MAADDDALATCGLADTRSDWAGTYAALTRADATSPLGSDDLELLATAAYLVGRVTDSVRALERAYQVHAMSGDSRSAVRCAFWLCFHHFNQGEFGQGSGWLSKAGRLVEGAPAECAERAYMLLPIAFQQVVVAGEYAAGRATATTALELARRVVEPDIVPLALNLVGRSLVREGRVAEGLAALDEAMVEVVSGEVSPSVAGTVYCSLIEACEEIAEVRRAQEWTEALTRWCDRQGGLVTFTGQCLVHRATIKQLHGEWLDALQETRLACERFSLAADGYASGMAMYRLGELHRMRGDAEAAEEAYRQSAEGGNDPQPGLALLRLEQGRADTAGAAIRRAVDECHDQALRVKLLPAFVEIVLAEGDVASARRGADELGEAAAVYGTPALGATWSQALGAVLVAEGDPRRAVATLRSAWRAWRELAAPYEEARVRVLIAQGCRALGDGETATLELETARRAFERLGARPDLARVAAELGEGAEAATHGLTARESEVLRLVATGLTNQAIADELHLAVKTVDRHVSNIFTKLGVASRAAATAFAYQHRLT